MIGLLCPFRQLMWNRLLVARQGVLMTGRHMGRTKGAVHMGTPFITAHSCSKYIYIYIYIKAALIRKKIKEVDVRTVCAQASVLFFFKNAKKKNSRRCPCLPHFNKDTQTSGKYNNYYITRSLFKPAAVTTKNAQNCKCRRRRKQKSKSMPPLMTVQERRREFICEEGTGQKHN